MSGDTDDTVPVVSPDGQERQQVAPAAQVGPLAVVDDPWQAGYTVVVAEAGVSLSWHRFATPQDAATVAAKVEQAADWTLLATRRGRKQLGADVTLRDRIVAAAAATPSLLPRRQPQYPARRATGVSYDPGYDRRRREARQQDDGR